MAKKDKAEQEPEDSGKEKTEGAEEPVEVEAERVGEPKEIEKDARLWGMLCHLLGLAGLIMPVVGNIVGPLVIWQIKKDEFPFVDEQGKEAVNFQISMTMYGVISGVLTIVCIGFFMLAAVYIVDLVFLLIAAVKANNGQSYRYPLTIRFIK
ncbi:MAG: DUF4870 domain-containing protein [Planctomycetota bacterium]